MNEFGAFSFNTDKNRIYIYIYIPGLLYTKPSFSNHSVQILKILVAKQSGAYRPFPSVGLLLPKECLRSRAPYTYPHQVSSLAQLTLVECLLSPRVHEEYLKIFMVLLYYLRFIGPMQDLGRLQVCLHRWTSQRGQHASFTSLCTTWTVPRHTSQSSHIVAPNEKTKKRNIVGDRSVFFMISRQNLSRIHYNSNLETSSKLKTNHMFMKMIEYRSDLVLSHTPK